VVVANRFSRPAGIGIDNGIAAADHHVNRVSCDARRRRASNDVDPYVLIGAVQPADCGKIKMVRAMSEVRYGVDLVWAGLGVCGRSENEGPSRAWPCAVSIATASAFFLPCWSSRGVCP
jgi:hypothetical protein